MLFLSTRKKENVNENPTQQLLTYAWHYCQTRQEKYRQLNLGMNNVNMASTEYILVGVVFHHYGELMRTPATVTTEK